MASSIENTRPTGLKKIARLAVMIIPTLGLLVTLFSWMAPSLNLPYSIGIGIFLLGWFMWALTMPLFTRERLTYPKQFVFFLFFFPVMYPFVLALTPWAMTLTRRHEEIQRGLADGSIKIEIPSRGQPEPDEPSKDA